MDRPQKGALISTRLEGRVGYLLDELPMGMRDRVAEQLIEQPEATWQARARAQVGLTGYRLAFRDAYYEEEEGRGQLPLPPAEKWQITLTGDPARSQVLDHDLVLVDYVMESTLLTDEASPEVSDPAFASVGGSWDEPFVLPLDPELLLQRTGYACMDEEEFPPNSVDGENVATFYDQDCEGGEDGGCHITEVPEESCLDALDAAVGSLSLDLHFERVAWDPALAEQARVGNAGRAGADLEVIGEGLDNRRIIYRYIDGDSCAMAENCVTGLGWRRLLQFDASIKNVGADALHIGDVDLLLGSQDTLLASHNIFVYSACHEHYHFTHYGEFELQSEDTALGNKQAFCLQSTTRYGNNETSPLTHPYGSCAYQGIQAGWGDDYGAGIECQWIDVSDVAPSAPVNAQLDFKLNPDQFLCEGSPVLDAEGEPVFADSGFRTPGGLTVDRPECNFRSNWDANNEEARPVTIKPTGSFVTEPCTRGQLGPRRDCGFEPGVSSVTEVACAPGSSVSLRCSVPSGSAPAVVRVCEYSEKWSTGVACVYREALANGVVDGSAVDLEVTCPEARDAIEVGGHVALYSAPVLPGDEVTVSCSVQ
ncbi:MAG TPA: lysyl oxidase family protein [Polyangiaceae bacterium]|nr:lysyl oxidase family protein [Polyangiaceae bacterium]